MPWFAGALLFFQLGQDSIRQHEVAEYALRSQTRTVERERGGDVARQRRNFEERFNALVTAVEVFAKEYNLSKGQVWPKRTAEELRLAMKQLQDEEPMLRPRKLARHE